MPSVAVNRWRQSGIAAPMRRERAEWASVGCVGRAERERPSVAPQPLIGSVCNYCAVSLRCRAVAGGVEECKAPGDRYMSRVHAHPWRRLSPRDARFAVSGPSCTAGSELRDSSRRRYGGCGRALGAAGMARQALPPAKGGAVSHRATAPVCRGPDGTAQCLKAYARGVVGGSDRRGLPACREASDNWYGSLMCTNREKVRGSG